MACLPQCPTHLPHSIHFSGSMTGSPNPDCVIAPTGQTVSSGHRWFCGQRRLSTVSAMPVYLLSSTLSMASLSDALGRAPCAIWGLPLVGMKSSVGIERMPNAAASLLLFGIHLVDVDAVAVLGSQLFQNRGECLAGAAPRCVEVDERRFVAEVLPLRRVRFVICDFGQEIRLGQCDRFHGILFFSVVFLVAAVCAGCQAEHAHRGQ